MSVFKKNLALAAKNKCNTAIETSNPSDFLSKKMRLAMLDSYVGSGF